MPTERIAPQSEVIRAIALVDSPCCRVPEVIRAIVLEDSPCCGAPARCTDCHRSEDQRTRDPPMSRVRTLRQEPWRSAGLIGDCQCFHRRVGGLQAEEAAVVRAGRALLALVAGLLHRREAVAPDPPRWRGSASRQRARWRPARCKGCSGLMRSRGREGEGVEEECREGERGGGGREGGDGLFAGMGEVVISVGIHAVRSLAGGDAWQPPVTTVSFCCPIRPSNTHAPLPIHPL